MNDTRTKNTVKQILRSIKYDDFVKSLKMRFFVIPANPGSSPGQAPESRVPGENRDPVLEMVPDFRRDDV